MSKSISVFLISLMTLPIAAGDRSEGPTASRHAARLFMEGRCETLPPVYPWKTGIKATVFWVGEQPTANNPTPNCKSSWDTRWVHNFGGYDNPSPHARAGFRPRAFVPRLNPFYIALPYNDVRNWRSHKPEAREVIPWFDEAFERPGKSVCHGRWVAIRLGHRVCYAQWEDCGPITTTDWPYVFGDARPAAEARGAAGIDVSPAVRDFLGMSGLDDVDWRFVELNEVPPGPWRKMGENNPFVQSRAIETRIMEQRGARLRAGSAVWVRQRPDTGR